MTLPDFIVRPATLDDLTYIDHLQRKNAEELSFYPRAIFEREIPLFRVLLAEFNAEPCGYLYHGAFGTTLRIHQACIQYDLRGQLYGSALVRHLRTLAESNDVHSIVLRCGSDIAANAFWRLMGFECEQVTPGGVRRMRDINMWVLRLQPALFGFAVEPSERAQDASLWRKHKDGTKSQFMRGKALRHYREQLLAREHTCTPQTHILDTKQGESGNADDATCSTYQQVGSTDEFIMD